MLHKLHHLQPHSTEFPPVERALDEPNGLLATGGDLSTPRLLAAYQCGIFPWFNVGEPILWWSPDPRAVLLPQQVHISRSMQKLIRKHPFKVTVNHDFMQVIHNCATRPNEETWIGPQLTAAFIALHKLGIAHSIEVWQGKTLVAGLYGLSIGTLFCGESMFTHTSNASKYALIAFCQHFVAHGGQLIDCQILNSHTASLGATEIPRQEFLATLKQLQQQEMSSFCWQQQEISIISD